MFILSHNFAILREGGGNIDQNIKFLIIIVIIIKKSYVFWSSMIWIAIWVRWFSMCPAVRRPL